MPRATETQRALLGETFARLCRIRSVSGEERAIADHVTAELRALGLEVEEDDTAATTGAGSGNLLARIPGRGPRSVVLCAHLDTVPHPGQVEPVLDDGRWTSAGDTILGADNKAALAVLLEVARHSVADPPPVGVELLLTASEEVALRGAKAFDVGRLRSDVGFVFDHATPIGGVITASPTYFRIDAHFRGQAAHAGIEPELGRSAIVAASRAIVAVPHGRLDAETTANVGQVRGGVDGTNVVPEHCSFAAEVRSLDAARAEAVVAQFVDAVHDAANEPACSCDVDVDVQRLFEGYRHGPSHPGLAPAEAALRACGFEPQRIASGGGSDANAFEVSGFPCLNLANGTERAHQTDEAVSVVALESMLDVVLALLDECGRG